MADASARFNKVTKCSGFFYITNHALDDAVREGAFAVAAKFFALAAADKEICLPTVQRFGVGIGVVRAAAGPLPSLEREPIRFHIHNRMQRRESASIKKAE